MKKSTLRILIVIMILLALTIVAAIVLTVVSQFKISPDTKDIISDITNLSGDDDEESTDETAEDQNADEITDEADNKTDADTEDTAATEPEAADVNGPSEDETPSPGAEAGPLKVVWLGDSLTQGSLKDDNNNENNPQAPWRVLKELSGYDVEGFGYYGLYAHDILWKWGEEGGVKDPGTVYIFWIGSCDFRDSQDNVSKVIDEIDTFLKNGNLNRYLVMGTTNRPELGMEGAENVNKKFKEKYGDNYIDILQYVEFGPDDVHLTEASYHDIAEAVYAKLRSLYGDATAE